MRPDVAANCYVFLDLCKKAGYPVLITSTIRDQEQQTVFYKKGTGGKTVTFHKVGVGLAFDVCKNVKGQEYSDNNFWYGIGEIGKRVGFSWGYSLWGKDKPHFQWDEHGKYKDSHIKAGKYPASMPKYKEETKLDKTIREEVKEKFGLADSTMDFLEAYKFSDELLRKLMEGK